jgi:hypothetical protein
MFILTSKMHNGRPIIYVSLANKAKLNQIAVDRRLKSLDAALDLVLVEWEKELVKAG